MWTVSGLRYRPARTADHGLRKGFRYTYNDDGELVRRVVNGETVAEYEHTSTAVIESDALGHETRTDRNRYDEPIRIKYPDGATESWSYNEYGQVTRHVDEVGTVTEHTYDDAGNRIKTVEGKGSDAERVIEYEYDQYGRRTLRRLVGDADTKTAVTRWSYDAYGNVTARTDPMGHTTQLKSHTAWGQAGKRIDARGNTWTRKYDNAGNLTKRTTPEGRTTTISYNAVGQRTSIQRPGRPKPTKYAYNDAGQLVQMTDPTGASQRITYGPNRKPTKITDPLGRKATITYNDRGQRNKIKDSAGNSVTFNYGDTSANAAPGQLAEVVSDYQTTSYRYDKRGRRTREIRTGNNDDTRAVEQYRYDAAGLRTAVIAPGGAETTYSYDALGRRTQKTKPDGNTVQYRYDDAGNEIAVVNETGVTIRTYDYNKRGDRTAVHWPGGETQRYSYNSTGQRISHTKADGAVIRHAYNADGQRTATRYFDSKEAGEPTRTINYSYNTAGNLAAYDDGTTSASYEYNARQQRTKATVDFGPFAKTIEYAYNAAGQLSALTYPSGRTMRYEYNRTGAFKRARLPEGIINVTEYHGVRPQRVLYPGGTEVTTTYDGLGRPTRIRGKDPADDPLVDERYSYQADGNLARKQTLDGTRKYTYDAVDRLTKVTDGKGVTQFSYTYDPAGNRTSSKKHPETWQYNKNNQLTSYADRELTYDADGNTTAIDKPAGKEDYEYNHGDRLTQYKGPNGTQANYAYDPQGRRIKKTVDGETRYFLYSRQGLVGVYDSDGNATATYGWYPNRLWGTDPLWRRSDGETHYYVTDRLATPIAMFDQTGAREWTSRRTPFQLKNLASRRNPLGFPGQYRDNATGLDYNFNRTIKVPSVGISTLTRLVFWVR